MDPSCPRHSNYEPTVNYDTIIYACAIMGGIAIPITIFVIGALYGIFKRPKQGIDQMIRFFFTKLNSVFFLPN